MSWKQSLDRWLTTEPDNGYHDWVEQVFDNITPEELPDEDYNGNEAFFDAGLLQMSRNNFPSPIFCAKVLVRRFGILKANPHLKTWEEVQAYSLSI
jgi:hypothetical protein